MLSRKDFKAPKGKIRVIGVDTFDGLDWIVGDYKTKKEAFEQADAKGGEMMKIHVYDDEGNHLHEAGKF
jgi:hypothetical protein